ncbi:hypothetical protein R3P38DRAFT_2952014 [Favolaschia claudopus]|uniref:Uncharacterized protein n=1 Tax=Favolaschia claudopus TaxID=2862362 RepID=A0AAW0BFL6_9AGAR
MSDVYSLDEESPILENFVNNTIAQQTQTTSRSPRTELLSPVSPSARAGEIGHTRSGQRGPSDGFRRQREEAYAHVSHKQVLHFLVNKEYEASKLRKNLNKVVDRLETEARRAADAERVAEEALTQLRRINDGKIDAERLLAKVSEELRLWKFQFNHAQSELSRALEVVKLVEFQRDDAEQAASSARSTARQLHELRMVSDAMEEGKKLGYEAGFRRAQQEFAMMHGTTTGEVLRDLRLDDSYPTSPPENAQTIQRSQESTQSIRDLNTSPVAVRSPQQFRIPQDPIPGGNPPLSMPEAIVMPHPDTAPPRRPLETEPARQPPPSPQLSVYPIEIPSASALNVQPLNRRSQQSRPTSQAPPPPAPTANPPSQPRLSAQIAEQLQHSAEENAPQPQPRPSSRQRQRPPTTENEDRRPTSRTSIRPGSTSMQEAVPPLRALTPEQPQYELPPDNYIPSITEGGGITLPPPFQLSQPLLSAMSPKAPPAEPHRTQSWYNSREQEQPMPQGQNQQGQTQSWYQPKRPRSNAGSTTGRSAAGGSVSGRSAAQAQHGRQASLDSRLSVTGKGQKYAGGDSYSAAGLGAISEVDTRSMRSGKSHRSRSMLDHYGAPLESMSRESMLVADQPPPLPAKDARHQNQMIADELRYSDPDLAESWRREAARADPGPSMSRPPRNVRVPGHLTMPTPLSPPRASVPLNSNQMRARSMSGSTGKSGITQPLAAAAGDLGRGPSLRRVAPRRPPSPSEVGTPQFGTITVQPPSQPSSTHTPMVDAPYQPIDQYLSPNYQPHPLPVPGFVPQSVTVPAQITMPVNPGASPFKAKVTAGPDGSSIIEFPEYPGDDVVLANVPKALGGRRSRAGSVSSLNAGWERSPSRHNRSSDAAALPVNVRAVGPMLTAGPPLSHKASNASLSSNGSYARFDRNSYVDPAFWGTESVPVPAPMPVAPLAPRSRKSSNNSGSALSYIG